jgi:hypothetical protein
MYVVEKGSWLYPIVEIEKQQKNREKEKKRNKRPL